MGRVYRKQVMDILNLMEKMHGEIQKAVQHKETQRACQLIVETQESAIMLGNSVEERIGEESCTVKAIEEYCELAYQLHTALERGLRSDVILRNLHSQCQQIRHNAEKELSNQYEMVFLPYKASMWDSLESVWRAADAEPDCEAYVIPIPYYDKNPDGTFRSEHYEGEEFPEDVPVTHYLEYDFEKRCPDVIFIHNPYDDHNFITSVHPYFYTARLKEYAEKLVYIPYYVSAEVNPDNKAIIEEKAGLSLTNGVLHSDMVFVQSENTKKLFVNILEKNIPEIDRSYWENKIWGLGSPKLDRVNRVVRDDSRLPQGWHDMIYTESGSRKKVVFYNISISTLLKNDDMLNKIKDVLMFFKNNRDTVLWWRPHPLYESMFASMRPDMLPEYQQIVNQYKKEAWGIFDDGVDLQWAIAETDAYYGDTSSVIQLFREVGKPVMIQDVNVRTQHEIKAEDIPVWPSAFCVDGDDVWFIHGKVNVLMRYNMRENHTYVIDTIPDEEMFQESLYRGIYKWDNKIFMIPCWAREIAVYDTLSGKIEKLPIRDIDKYDNKVLFHKAYLFDRYLYCIPYYYESVIRLDMATLDIEYIDISKVLGEQVYLNDSVKVGNELIAIIGYTNRALFLQMESGSMQVKELGTPERKFTSMANIGHLLYLFDSATSMIVKINEESISAEEKLCVMPYKGVRVECLQSDFIVFDPSDSKDIRVMDSKETFVFENSQEIRGNNLYPTFYCGIEGNECKNRNNSYYFNAAANLIYKFNGEGLEKQILMSLENNEMYKLRKLYADRTMLCVDENNIYGLGAWVDKLKETKVLCNGTKHNNGEKILYTVKKYLLS